MGATAKCRDELLEKKTIIIFISLQKTNLASKREQGAHQLRGRKTKFRKEHKENGIIYIVTKDMKRNLALKEELVILSDKERKGKAELYKSEST